MKFSAKTISVLIAGGVAGSVFGQVTADDLARTTDWGMLSEAFTNNITALFSDSENAFDSFTFGWNPTDVTTGKLVTNPVGANPTGRSYELAFTILDVNPEFITSDLAIPVSYLGNESVDDNFFGFTEYGMIDIGNGPEMGPVGPNVALYNYYGFNSIGAVDDPDGNIYSRPSNPDILEEDNGDYPISVSFWHEDEGFGTYGGNELERMGSESRFYIFEATEIAWRDGARYEDTYLLLAVDDRESVLIDYDDGFFLARYSSVMAVPEPSAIGFAAFALLLGLGVTRRNRKA